MDEIKYYCYICDEELTDTNNSDEHIILNSIGGHLHSKQLLCKRCNSKLGDTADAKLAEDLSFYTDMLKVKKVRKNPHKQIMLDDEGREVCCPLPTVPVRRCSDLLLFSSVRGEAGAPRRDMRKVYR